MSRRGPRCVFLDRLPGTLTVGEFVHVKEVIGPDRQKNKVYRILRFSADEPTFLGEYYEQPLRRERPQRPPTATCKHGARACGAVRLRLRPLHRGGEWQWHPQHSTASGRAEAVRLARASGEVGCLGTPPAPRVCPLH